MDKHEQNTNSQNEHLVVLLIRGRKMVDQKAHNPIAEGELGWNDKNRKPIASILCKFLLVMLFAAVRKAAV